MPAQEITPGPVELGDAPAAGGPVHDAGADEIGPSSAKSARCEFRFNPAGDSDLMPATVPI